MKYVKTMFLISLFNFFLVGGIVLAVGQIRPKEIVNNEAPKMAIPTMTEATVTLLPTETKMPRPTKIKDPFAVIFEGAPPTNKPSNQTINLVPTTQTQNPTNPPAAPTTDNRCIISIVGTRYDITMFRNLHSGGDIFQCGSDMSAIFHNQHPNSFLNQLAKYKI